MTKIKRGVIAAIAAGPCFVSPSLAEAHTEMYYPATMCVPGSAGAFEGSGASGLFIINGEWANNDNDDVETLHCPVPYARNTNDLRPVKVNVAVRDGSNNAGGKVKVILCWDGAIGQGDAECTSDETEGPSVGNNTLTVSLTPQAETRFFRLSVQNPPKDGSSRSGLSGYRAFR